jgi:hypothetical protein
MLALTWISTACLLYLGIPFAQALPNELKGKESYLNSERLARGLTPMKPRRLYDATKTRTFNLPIMFVPNEKFDEDAARAGIPSGTPPGTT